MTRPACCDARRLGFAAVVATRHPPPPHTQRTLSAFDSHAAVPVRSLLKVLRGRERCSVGTRGNHGSRLQSHSPVGATWHWADSFAQRWPLPPQRTHVVQVSRRGVPADVLAGRGHAAREGHEQTPLRAVFEERAHGGVPRQGFDAVPVCRGAEGGGWARPGGNTGSVRAGQAKWEAPLVQQHPAREVPAAQTPATAAALLRVATPCAVTQHCRPPYTHTPSQ